MEGMASICLLGVPKQQWTPADCMQRHAATVRIVPPS